MEYNFDNKTTIELIKYLRTFATEKRQNLFEEVITQRTKYITVVLEDIYQPHNASAVLRSCDCFGIQNVHIIENENEFQVNPDVALGSSKWIDIHKYNENENNTVETIEHLKKQGYRIVATTPHTNDVNLEEFDVSKGKFALLFGSEKPGLSEIALNLADEYMKIPMFGFTESFNISVSAAISLHTLTTKLHASSIPFQLPLPEQNKIVLEWLMKSVKSSKSIINKFLQN